MYKFSSKTEVNKEFKLSDFLKQIKASQEVIHDAKKIKSIKFRNVINATTLNCIENDKYINIYVIEINLYTPEIPKLFISELDKNISFHTYFVLRYDHQISTLIAYKDISNKISVDRYYCHNFHDEEALELPIINSVTDLYKLLLAYEIRIPYRNSEKPNEYITRVRNINRLKFQISKTEKAIFYETQPKKQFVYNNRLHNYKKQLKELTLMEE